MSFQAENWQSHNSENLYSTLFVENDSINNEQQQQTSRLWRLNMRSQRLRPTLQSLYSHFKQSSSHLASMAIASQTTLLQLFTNFVKGYAYDSKSYPRQTWHQT